MFNDNQRMDIEYTNVGIQVYNKQTAPLLKYYQKKDLIKRIDGSGNIDSVYQQIVKVLE